MHRKIRLKKKVKVFKIHKKKDKLMLVLVGLIICIILLFKLINSKFSPSLVKIASSEIEKLCNILITYSIDEEVKKGINFDDMFIITKDKDENIKSIDLDPNVSNKILLSITNSIQNNLKRIESGDVKSFYNYEELFSEYDISKLEKGIVYEITSGAVFDNALLANIGPKIPIKLSLTGNISGVINTSLTDYGINNALLKVNIDITIKEMLILPVTTDSIEIKNSIPIALKLIQGSIPSYYFDSLGKNSSTLTIPVE